MNISSTFYRYCLVFIAFFTAITMLPTTTSAADLCTTVSTDPSSLKAGELSSKPFTQIPNKTWHYYRVTVSVENPANIDRINLETQGIPVHTAIDSKVNSLSELDTNLHGFYVDVANKTVTFEVDVVLDNGIKPHDDQNINPFQSGDYKVIIYNSGGEYCSSAMYSIIEAAPTNSPTPSHTPTPDPSADNCRISISPDFVENTSTPVTIYIYGSENFLKQITVPGSGHGIQLLDSRKNTAGEDWFELLPNHIIYDEVNYYSYIKRNIGTFNSSNDSYGLTVKDWTAPVYWDVGCSPVEFFVGVKPTPSLPPGITPSPTPIPELKNICENIPLCANIEIEELRKSCVERCTDIKDLDEQAACAATYPGGSERKKCNTCQLSGNAYTALGCVPTDLPSFVQEYVYTFGIGTASSIAFLLMLWGGFTMLTSAGDPQKLAHGREIFVAAIVGLLFIIFAIFILEVIGVNILRLPGFGPTPTVVPGHGNPVEPPPSENQCLPADASGFCASAVYSYTCSTAGGSVECCALNCAIATPTIRVSPTKTLTPTPTTVACLASGGSCKTNDVCQASGGTSDGVTKAGCVPPDYSPADICCFPNPGAATAAAGSPTATPTNTPMPTGPGRPGGLVAVNESFTSTAFSSAIGPYLISHSDPSLNLSNIAVSFATPNAVQFTGNTSRGRYEAAGIFVVENDQLKFKIDSLTVGGINILSTYGSAVETGITSAIYAAILPERWVDSFTIQGNQIIVDSHKRP